MCCESFSHWRSPHGDLPPLWHTWAVDAAATRVGGEVSRRCVLSNYGDGLEMAHLLPAGDDDWWLSNQMQQYSPNAAVSERSNSRTGKSADACGRISVASLTRGISVLYPRLGKSVMELQQSRREAAAARSTRLQLDAQQTASVPLAQPRRSPHPHDGGGRASLRTFCLDHLKPSYLR